MPTTAAAFPRRPRSSADSPSVPTQASTWPTPSRRSKDTKAINYLFAHHDLQYIDTNHDGLVTAGEVQTFTDNAAAMGMPEAGAMAALLGGTATYSAVQPGLNNLVFNENPDDPAAEQRRFNFFDYAADGQLNGSITMNELKMLSRILLPAPDAYAVTDRQRASANGFLLDPTAQRNFVALAAHPADVRVGAEVGGPEVPQHLADEIRRRQGPGARNHLPALHAVRPIAEQADQQSVGNIEHGDIALESGRGQRCADPDQFFVKRAGDESVH